MLLYVSGGQESEKKCYTNKMCKNLNTRTKKKVKKFVKADAVYFHFEIIPYAKKFH